MNRRYFFKETGFIILYSSLPVVLAEFASSCNNKNKTNQPVFFSNDEFQLIEEITDNLLPRTATPGALDAQTPYFIDLLVKNCMNEHDQSLIKKGLQQFNEQTKGKFKSFSKEDKLNEIKKTDEAAFKDDPDKAWFRIIKKLSLIGYFTSQEGMTKALTYVKVPGEYKACIPYKNGEKALAKTFLMYW